MPSAGSSPLAVASALSRRMTSPSQAAACLIARKCSFAASVTVIILHLSSAASIRLGAKLFVRLDNSRVHLGVLLEAVGASGYDLPVPLYRERHSGVVPLQVVEGYCHHLLAVSGSRSDERR